MKTVSLSVLLSIFLSLIFPAENLLAQDTNFTNSVISSEFQEDSLFFDANGDGQLVVVGFGDSITRGMGDFVEPGLEILSTRVPAGEAGFPLRIETLASIEVFNNGISGERVLGNGVSRFLSVVQELRPDLVIILEGSNDAVVNENPNNLFRGYQTMVNAARALGSNVVISTIPAPCCNRVSRRANTLAYNDEIRKIATINEIRLADTDKAYRNTCDTNNCSLLNLPEGLHPNRAGYDVIGESVLASALGFSITQPDGPTLLEEALSLTPGSVLTVPDAAS